MGRLYFALDLKDDAALIAEYERWHSPGKIWPEVVEALKTAGVRELEIFRCGNRLVMVVEGPGGGGEGEIRAEPVEVSLPRNEAWEELMWKFQQRLPFAAEGEKWVRMKSVFSLREALDWPSESGE
jgi:L-rhamnose mutarotase